MIKSKKLVLILDMSMDGKTKAEIAKKLSITANAFYKNKSYSDAYGQGQIRRVQDARDMYVRAYSTINTKNGLSAKDALEIFPRKLDTFELTKKDYKDITSMAIAINKVALAEVESQITSTRAKNLTERLMTAITAVGKSIEFQEFQEWKNGISKQI